MAASGEQYLTIQEVAGRTKASTKSIRRKVRAGEFPAPFRWLGGLMWLESEVDRWMVENAIRERIKPSEMPGGEKGGWTGRDSAGQSGTSAPEVKIPSGEPTKRR